MERNEVDPKYQEIGAERSISHPLLHHHGLHEMAMGSHLYGFFVVLAIL